MKILAIETATEACSAALYCDGEILSRYELAPRKHTQLIIPMMDSLLQEADLAKSALDAIAFGRGPGAFTGLRIAVGVAQGLALALDKPVVPVSTLAAMSQQIADTTADFVLADDIKYIPAIDARMGEVYWGEYSHSEGVVRLIGEEQLAKPEILTQFMQDNCLRFGSGWEAYHAEALIHDTPEITRRVKDSFPRAYYVAKLAAIAFERGELMDAADAEPVYLRNDVAKKKADQGKAS